MINKDLENFIRHYTQYQGPIGKNIRIVGELITNQDSVYPFIIDYADTFQIDISEFDIQKYLTNNDRINLTIGDLERGIELGKLNESIVELKNDEQQLPLKFSIKNILTGIILLIVITGILLFVAFFI